MAANLGLPGAGPIAVASETVGKFVAKKQPTDPSMFKKAKAPVKGLTTKASGKNGSDASDLGYEEPNQADISMPFSGRIL
jgi:hypothetical protein